MTDPQTTNEPPGALDAVFIPAARNYLFVGFAALVVYFMLMSEKAGNLATLLAFIIAGCGLIARWVISPALFLILTTYFLCDPNFDLFAPGIHEQSGVWRTSYGSPRKTEFQLADLLLVTSILIYLMSQFRLLSLVHKGMPDDPPPRRKGQPEPETPRRPANLFSDREIGQMLGLAPICVLAGLSIWFVIEKYETVENLGGIWGVERWFARLMLFSWIFISGALLIGVVFRYIALRNMSRFEARLMLQDMFWRETRREQERIHRWRQWFRKRQADRESGRGS